MVVSVLLKDFKRKQADALLQCGIIFYTMIPHFPFADLGGLHGLWPVPPMVQVQRDVEGVSVKGMSQAYPAYRRPDVCQSYCLSHSSNNELTAYPHKRELSLN